MSAPKTRRELALLATGGLVASALAASYARPAAARQENMERAKAALEDAMRFLEVADADKGGHRVAAIRAIKAAIAEVDAGIRFDITH